MWAERGSRPVAIKQTGYEWVYCYAAVNPETGESVSILAPSVNTETMNAFLIQASQVIPADTHAVMILDGAGWHSGHALVVPANITLLHLPPYSPELNPVERLWAFLKSHYMSNRAFADYDAIFNAATDAINRVDEAAIRSICACDYLRTDI